MFYPVSMKKIFVWSPLADNRGRIVERLHELGTVERVERRTEGF
ncbi:hypothetical protein BMS3Bbin16_00878 [archaeon BMS3Bbin16]|nr:hypothetical protein BMS3Bbin16_00878 [archaeon BMS3Bbin16]